MGKKIFAVLLLLSVLQALSCVAIYRSVRDKRDRNYKEGVELFKQNRIPEARARFETVVEIEPDFKDVKQYLKKTGWLLSVKERNANINYEKSVALMGRGRYDDALSLLLTVKEQDRNHPDADEKIEECRSKLTQKFDKLLAQAEHQFKRKQYIPAYNTHLKAKVYNPSSGQLSSLKRRIEEKLEERAEKYVTKGKDLNNKKQYAAAQTQLHLALRENPWDRDTKELYDKINGKLNLDKNYSSGIALYNGGNYFGAKSAFSQVNAIEPGYKDTNQYLGKINTALGGQIGTFYNNGVSFYDKGNYEAAISEFTKVLSINPGHSNAQEYRQRAQTKLEMQKSLQGGNS